MTSWIDPTTPASYSDVPGEFGDSYGNTTRGPALTVGDTIIEAPTLDDLRTLLARLSSLLPDAGPCRTAGLRTVMDDPEATHAAPRDRIDDDEPFLPQGRPFTPVRARRTRLAQHEVMDRIADVVHGTPSEPPDHSPESLAQWRATRSGALSDITQILTESSR